MKRKKFVRNIAAYPPEPSPDAQKKGWWRWLALAIGLPVGVVAPWALIRWLQHLGRFEWLPDWLFLDSDLSAPAATLLASGGVIIAAFIAFWNGENTRREERDRWSESKRQETVRSLRDRYFNITDLLSGNSNYAQREAAVYSLVDLSDDWASFYGDGTEAAAREQQTCLNVIVGQLRDPLPEKDDHKKTRELLEVLVFKQRVQDVIIQRYQAHHFPDQREWSHLNLDLSFCNLYKPDFSSCVFIGKTRFDSAIFDGGFAVRGGGSIRGMISFRGATFTDPSFIDATFTGHTSFQDATFTGHTSFQDATFTGGTTFQGATFTGDVSSIGYTCFIATTFTGGTIFDSATFDNTVHFMRARFLSYTTFGDMLVERHPRQTHKEGMTANIERKRTVFKKSPVFEGPSQFGSSFNFNGSEFPTCPTLRDNSNPRDFFTGAIFLDELDREE